MNNVLMILIRAITMALLIASTVTLIIAAPKPWIPKREWPKRLGIVGAAAVVAVLCLELVLMGDGFWGLQPVGLLIALGSGLLVVPLVCIRMILLEQYTLRLDQLASKLRTRSGRKK